MAAFFMREVVWQLVGARTWRARQVLYDTCEPDLSERAPHVAPLQKKGRHTKVYTIMRGPFFLNV